MLWDTLKFYYNLCHHYLVGHYYRQEFITDLGHCHYRRLQKSYKKKQSLIKNFWIAAGLITLAFPFLAVAIILSIVTTFISFSILDETD